MNRPTHTMMTLLLTAASVVLLAPSASSAEETADTTATEQDNSYREALASARRSTLSRSPSLGFREQASS